MARRTYHVSQFVCFRTRTDLYSSALADFRFHNIPNVPNRYVFEREPARHRVLWADYLIKTECDGQTDRQTDRQTDGQQTDEQEI